MKILFAEDERDLREVVTAYLEHLGHQVTEAENGLEAVDRAVCEAYDVMVFDVMMPVMDGITAMKRIRAAGNTTPAIFLTAKGALADRVEGLDAGADDYLTKPFHFEELKARLGALERRVRKYRLPAMNFGNLELDAEASELRACNTIGLTNKEVALLAALISHASGSMTADELLKEVWTGESAGLDTLRMYISFLQAKLKSVRANVTIDGDAEGDFRLKVVPDV